MCEAKKGQNNPMFGTTHNEDTKLKISIARGITIYVYCSDKSTLLYTFTYARKAASGGLPRSL